MFQKNSLYELYTNGQTGQIKMQAISLIFIDALAKFRSLTK